MGEKQYEKRRIIENNLPISIWEISQKGIEYLRKKVKINLKSTNFFILATLLGKDMTDLLELKGEPLEIAGQRILSNMGLTCVYPLNDTRILDIDPGGSYSEGDHLEIDYLIPYNEYCLIGEITGRANERGIRRKYRRFRNHFNILRNTEINNDFWITLGVPNDQLREFRNVRNLLGFFLTNRFEEYDLSLDSIPQISCFYRSDCALLQEYSECIGEYSKNHFLQIFNISEDRGQRPLEINRDDHNLMISNEKQIVSGEVPRADIYTFEVNPYDILSFAHVYRRDELPRLASTEDVNYQRPLIPRKITEIRQNLLTNPDFMFPNSILAVLSSGCRYEERNHSLLIPQTYESISIIDGQHRLFSYANEVVHGIMGDNSRIIVTAILFEEANTEEINRYSAKAFVEINRNQTGIKRKHLDAIAYDLLGETDGRALAAKILFEANKRRGASLYGLFETNKRMTGILKATTIISALRPLTNANIFNGLVRVREGSSRYLLRQGYLNLFGIENIEELSNPETLIEQGIISIEHFFNFVSVTFHHDWPEPGERKNSSLEYSKMIAGLVRLLRQFVSEGVTWEVIQSELVTIRQNVMQLRGMHDYDELLFDPAHPDIPNSVPRDTDDFNFFNSNRENPISIELIMQHRYEE